MSELPDRYDLISTRVHNDGAITYGVVSGNNIIVLIKTGLGGSIYGYQNKYFNLAKRINEKYGYTVIVADNPYDGTDPLPNAFELIEEFISNEYTIYYMGVSMGALIGAWYSNKYPSIKRMLLINGPLNMNLDKTINELNKSNCEKITLVYGSLDPSMVFVKGLDLIKNNNASFVIKENMDHNFSQSMEVFMKLPFEYLLD